MDKLKDLFKLLLTMIVIAYGAGVWMSTQINAVSAHEGRIAALEATGQTMRDTLIQTKQRVDDIADFLNAPRRNN